MLVYPVQILTAAGALFLADFVISQHFYALFSRATHAALHKFQRTARLEYDGQVFQIVCKNAFVVFATPFAAEIVRNVQNQTLQQNYQFYQQAGAEDPTQGSLGGSEGLDGTGCVGKRVVGALAATGGPEKAQQALKTQKQHISAANVKIQLQNGLLFVNGTRADSYTPEDSKTARFVHALVCGANWYNTHMDAVVEELGNLEFCENFEEHTSVSRQLYSRKGVFNLTQAKSGLLEQDRAFPVYSILIHTLTHGRQFFDVQKATLSFICDRDRKMRGQKHRPETTHAKIVLKHGLARYTIESFTNIVQDEWVVRILDPRNATIQAMLEKVQLKQTAEKLRTVLQQHVYDFKNGVLRDLDKELRRFEAQAQEKSAMTRTQIQQEKSAMQRRATNECSFLVRDDYKIARYYDKLGIFICGQTHPTPARIIVFTGRSYYDILQLVTLLCDEAGR